MNIFHPSLSQIIHRDLKPANILLNDASDEAISARTAILKLTDFGLAKDSGLVQEAISNNVQKYSFI